LAATAEIVVVGRFVVPSFMPSAWFILELVAGVSVELPGLFWLQPTSVNAAIREIAESGIMDLIILFFVFILRLISTSVAAKALVMVGFIYAKA
jgi:hypothetical protein